MRQDREIVQHFEVLFTFVIAVAFVVGLYVLIRDYGPDVRHRPIPSAVMGLRAGDYGTPDTAFAGWL